LPLSIGRSIYGVNPVNDTCNATENYALTFPRSNDRRVFKLDLEMINMKFYESYELICWLKKHQNQHHQFCTILHNYATYKMFPPPRCPHTHTPGGHSGAPLLRRPHAALHGGRHLRRVVLLQRHRRLRQRRRRPAPGSPSQSQNSKHKYQDGRGFKFERTIFKHKEHFLKSIHQNNSYFEPYTLPCTERPLM